MPTLSTGGTPTQYPAVTLVNADGSAFSAAGGREIAYAESLVLSTNSTVTPADVSGVAFTVPAGTRPVRISYEATVYNGSADGVTKILLLVDGAIVNVGQAKSSAANDLHEISKFHRLAPSASDRTVKLQLVVGTIGVANIQGQNVGQPCAMWAVEC